MSDIETIAQVIGTLGERGTTAFIWWVVMQISGYVATGGSLVLGLVFILRTVRSMQTAWLKHEVKRWER